MDEDYRSAIRDLREMQARIRQIRDRYCDPKNKENPRYHSLSGAVSRLNAAIDDMEGEA